MDTSKNGLLVVVGGAVVVLKIVPMLIDSLTKLSLSKEETKRELIKRNARVAEMQSRVQPTRLKSSDSATSFSQIQGVAGVTSKTEPLLPHFENGILEGVSTSVATEVENSEAEEEVEEKPKQDGKSKESKSFFDRLKSKVNG